MTGSPIPPATSLPSLAELTAQRQAAAEDTDLDEPTRALMDQDFAKALDNLQAAEQADQRIVALAQELEVATQQIAELQQRLETPLPADVAPAGAGSDLDQEALNSHLKESESAAASAHQRLQEITEEIERRSVRRPQLADLTEQVQQQLPEVAQQLSAPPPDGERPQVGAIRTIRLQSRQHRLRRELTLLEQEGRTYEGTARYWTLQRDLAERDVREADRTVQYWQQETAVARRRQAENEAREARRAAARSYEPIRKEAERNLVLADENTELVEARRQTQAELDQLSAELAERTQAFGSLKKRAEAANYSFAIGVLLRNQKYALPDRDELRFRIGARQSEIAGLNLKLMEWEAERKPLIDLTSASSTIVAKLRSTSASISPADLQEQVQVLLAARLRLLGDLTENGSSQLDQLVRLDSQDKRLLETLEAEAHWLAEHVLWVRSTSFFGTQPRAFVAAATILLDQSAWHRTRNAILLDLAQNRGWWAMSAIVFIGLLVVRRRAKREVRKLGEKAARSNCTEFLLTIRALFLTVLVASPFPLMAWCLGMRLSTISRGDTSLQAVGMALQLVAGTWGIIALIRQFSKPHGIGDSHFDWPEKSMMTVCRTTRLLGSTLLPLLWIVTYAEYLGDIELVSSIGRLAYLGAMTCVGWAIIRLFRPSSPILQSLENQHSDTLLWRTRYVWIGLLLASPVVLGGLSLAGYHYTAIQLTGRVAATIGSGLVALFVNAFLSRWLLVMYRKLAMRRGRERRQQMLQAAQIDPDQPIPPDTTPELRLVDINDQARRLLRPGCGCRHAGRAVPHMD